MTTQAQRKEDLRRTHPSFDHLAKLFALLLFATPLLAEERYLLAADNQVIEVDRAGKVTAVLKHPGHGGIYDAWRLPDGGIAYAHRGGLAVFDAGAELVMEHKAGAGEKGVEANSVAVLEGGEKFALMDSGLNEIRIVDRSGAKVGATPLPDLGDEALHFRYRMIREVSGENAFWVCQYGRKTVLKVEKTTGRVLQSIPLDPLLKPSPAVKKAFAMLPGEDGTIWVSTSTGCQLLHLDAKGEKLGAWTTEDLGLRCRYLLGMSRLANGNLLVACGDYHLRNADEGRDLLAEIDTAGKVVWRLTRDQLIDRIEGVIEKKSGLEEMRITNVFVVDAAPSAAKPGPVPASEADAITAFLDRHCTTCHDDTKAEGGLDLLDLAFAPEKAANRTKWIRLHDRVAAGEMPPPEKKHNLSPEERAGFVALLGGLVDRADRAAIDAEGRGPVRRLTRVEYEHRLRDLLALPTLDIRDKLPEDRDSHGFTKVSKQLEVSRVQLEGWLDAAEAALRFAIAPGVAPVPSKTWRFTGTDLFPELGTFGEREAMFFAREGKHVVIDGNTYKAMTPEQRRDPTLEMALFRSATWPYYGYPRGFRAEHEGEYRVRISGRAVRQVADFRLVPAHQPQPMSFRARQPSGPDVSGDVRETGGWIDLQPEPREFETTIRLKKGETFEYSPLGLPVPFIRTDGGFFYDFPPMPSEGHPGIAIRWMEVEGPIAPESWPPASHRVLFGDLPLKPAPAGSVPAVEVVSADPDKDAQRLLRSFLERASCGPVAEESVGVFQRLVLARLGAGDSFAAAMVKGYEAILCSGHFLFLTEPSDRPDGQNAIAARLSHFLWSTAPDERLRALAKEGRLRDRGVLLGEVDRLVADPRFERFVADFTDQWLNLRQLHRDEPDGRLYPEYRVDEYLVTSMEKETRAFFTAMVRDNLPATALVSTGFAYVNDRLARHYDLPRVEGSAMRRVELPDWSPYGGILTQASVLKVTANGTTTSPVTRGVWVLERLLGGTPPPPPKSVPAIEPDIRGATTIREILAKHTEVESCAACHTHFDPLGFALENFDVMGAWRDRYRGMEKGEKITGIDRAGHPYVYFAGPAVDAAGRLRSGESFDDVRGLKSILTKQPRVLARNLLGHLVLYATGTPVRFSERAEADAILDRVAAGGYRTGDLIRELAASTMFLGRSGPTQEGVIER
jgi:hypothetical protein